MSGESAEKERKRCVSCWLQRWSLQEVFMGIGKFSTYKRSINIADTARPVSGEADVSGNGDRLKIHAKAAVLIDGTSGRVLYQKNPYKHLPPASVTKVMTLLLIMEACGSGRISLKDKVTVSERAAGMGGSQMYMEPGERHPVGRTPEEGL